MDPSEDNPMDEQDLVEEEKDLTNDLNSLQQVLTQSQDLSFTPEFLGIGMIHHSPFFTRINHCTDQKFLHVNKMIRWN
jgi:hypothetical protein